VSKNATALEQLRDLPDEELSAALARTRDELFRLQLGKYTNQVTSTALLTGKRRDIARLMTVLRGRALSIETQAKKSSAKADKAEKPAKTKKTSKS
jgi:large subunit ribosomal protein L29